MVIIESASTMEGCSFYFAFCLF